MNLDRLTFPSVPISLDYPVWERVIHLLDRGLTHPEAI